MSAAWASKLMTVVKRMPREQALKLGAAKAGAIVELVDATPQRDTPAGVLARGARLPSGERLDVKHASGRAIERAAKAVRAAAPKRSARWRQVAAEDAAYGTKLERTLQALCATEAKVRVVAGLPGKPARLRIEGVTVGQAPLLAKAIAKVR